MQTALLDLTTWDFVLNTNGDLAMASDPYSVAQDVASACRTFLGEVWYDTTIGVPYFQDALGQNQPLALLRQSLIEAALTVPGCTNPVVYFDAPIGRVLTGQIQFTDSNGAPQVTGFGSSPPVAFLTDDLGNLITTDQNQGIQIT